MIKYQVFGYIRVDQNMTNFYTIYIYIDFLTFDYKVPELTKNQND